MSIDVELLDLTDGERTALGKLRRDKATQNLLQAILNGTKVPRYRQKKSIFNQLGDMVNQSGYRDGILDIVEFLSGKG